MAEEAEFDVDAFDAEPNRSQEEYGQWWEGRVLNKRGVPRELLFVNCPVHADELMTPVKIASSNFGQTVTFQCHFVEEDRTMCCILATIYRPIDSKAYVRPGDILKHETWDKAIEHVKRINYDQRVKRGPSRSNIILSEKPPNPWVKEGTLAYIIWDTFWDKIIEKGECSLQDLEEAWKARGRNAESASQTKKFYNQTRGATPLVNWMTWRSGFVIKFFGDVWRIVGRTEGDWDMYPWSDLEYREKFHGDLGY